MLTHSRGSVMRAASLSVWVLLVSIGLAGSALAQTATFTDTPTSTPTSTSTPTLAKPATPGSSDQAAWKYGSMRVATPVCPTPNSQTIIIPGLKQGDFITVYPPEGYRGGVSQRILTNNTLRLNMACSTAGGGDWEYLWYNRTQNNCQGAPNCGPAPTVTPTP